MSKYSSYNDICNNVVIIGLNYPEEDYEVDIIKLQPVPDYKPVIEFSTFKKNDFNFYVLVRIIHKETHKTIYQSIPFHYTKNHYRNNKGIIYYNGSIIKNIYLRDVDMLSFFIDTLGKNIDMYIQDLLGKYRIIEDF